MTLRSKDSPLRIALFGGSFDPPHLGHHAIAKDAADVCALDRVIFIPCRQSPHKDEPTRATGDQRVEMLELLAGEDERFTVSREELDRTEPSFSWQTAERFAAEHPDAKLFWILGHDQWAKLETWNRPDRLGELVTFIVFPREGETPVASPAFRSRFLERTHPASATGIREQLQLGESTQDLLSPAVAEFIRREGLYRAS